jgi:hypothetical protein
LYIVLLIEIVLLLLSIECTMNCIQCESVDCPIFFVLISTGSIVDSIKSTHKDDIRTFVHRTRFPFAHLESINRNPKYYSFKCLQSTYPWSGQWRYQMIIGPIPQCLLSKTKLKRIKTNWETRSRKLIQRIIWGIQYFKQFNGCRIYLKEHLLIKKFFDVLRRYPQNNNKAFLKQCFLQASRDLQV